MNEPDYDVASALSGLRLAVREAVSAPPGDVVRKHAEHHLRVRRAGTLLIAAAAVVAVAWGAKAAVRWNDAAVPPGNPTPSATPNGTPRPRPSLAVPPWRGETLTDPITQIDWGNATITVPAHQGCPSGRLRFNGGSTTGTWPRIVLGLPPDGTVTYGDLTGDGRPEAILDGTCLGGPEDSGDGQGQLLVVTRGGSGSLSALGWVGPRGGVYPGFWIEDGKVVADVHEWHTPWGYSLGAALSYRWQGNRFVEVDSGYPGIQPVGGEPFGPVIDLGPDNAPVATTLGCPGGAIRIEASDRFGIGPRATAAGLGGVVYSVQQPDQGLSVAHLLDLGGDGHRYLLFAIACFDATTPPDDVARGVGVRGQGVLVVDPMAAGQFRAVDLVTLGLDLAVADWRFDRGKLTVSTFVIATGNPGPTTTLTWNGSYFQP